MEQFKLDYSKQNHVHWLLIIAFGYALGAAEKHNSKTVLETPSLEKTEQGPKSVPRSRLKMVFKYEKGH